MGFLVYWFSCWVWVFYTAGEWTYPLLTSHRCLGLLSWFSGKRICPRCGRCGFHHWVRKTLSRRKWQPTLVFMLGKSHEQRSLVIYSPWGLQRVRYDLVTKQQQHCSAPEPLIHIFFPNILLITISKNLDKMNCKNTFLLMIVLWLTWRGAEETKRKDGGVIWSSLGLICVESRPKWRVCSSPGPFYYPQMTFWSETLLCQQRSI